MSINKIKSISKSAQMCSFLQNQGKKLGVKEIMCENWPLSLLSMMFENNKTWQYDRYLLGALRALNGLSVLQY